MPRPADYDDEKALDDYVARHRRHFMTPFEERTEHLGALREKALYAMCTADGPFAAAQKRSAAERLAEYRQKTDPEVEEALGPDLDSVRAYIESVTKRIRTAFAKGDLQAPRCPQCNGIVKTPLARQCLWCGHDWHNAE